MSYVLVIVLWSYGQSGSPAVSAVEFGTAETCQAAAAEIQLKIADVAGYNFARCYPK